MIYNTIYNKIGRYVTKFTSLNINETFSDKEIEMLTNLFKSFQKYEDCKFEVWEGDKLLEAYVKDNYYETKHLLEDSCMTDKTELLDIYVDNGVKCLVLVDSMCRILGRALLFNDVIVDNGKINYMDRMIRSN
jgi:hypothetical protein